MRNNNKSTDESSIPKYWNELSMADKADVMAAAVRNGITNLHDIRDKWNEFAEGGKVHKRDYASWKKNIKDYKHIDIDHDNTYDYQGFYNKYPDKAWGMLENNPDAHFTDEFKTVYHPTFSDESIYSGKYDKRYNPHSLQGGHWSEAADGRDLFRMSEDGYRSPVSMDERQQYLIDNEPGGVVLEESNGALSMYDGTLWGGVLPNVDVYGSTYAKGGKISRAQQAINYFVGKGLTKIQAAGLVGNLMRESNLNPKAVNPNGGAYGIAQWLGSRKTNLFKRYGSNPTFENQLDYVWSELNSTYRKGLQMLRTSRTAEDAARNAFGYYEFSAGPKAAVTAMNKSGMNTKWKNPSGYAALSRGIRNAQEIYGRSPEIDRALSMDLSHLPSMYDNNTVIKPVIEQPYYTVPNVELPQEEPQITLEEPKEEKPDILGNISRIQNIFNLFGDTDTAQQLNPLTGSFLEAWKGLGNSYAEGGKKEGITSSNGNYHVNPIDYWAVLSNAENDKPLEVTTPEVTVTAANPKNYRSSYNPNGFMDFMNTVTLGIGNRFSLTQNAKLLIDAYNASIGKKSWSDVGNSAILGNDGVFENPYANMLIDTALPMAFGQAQRLNELSKLKKIGYTGVPHKEILVGKDKKPLLDFNGSPVYMDEHFPLTHKEHTIWTSDDVDYGRTFINKKGTVYDVYADPKKLKVLETPKPSDTEYIKWTQLPYKYQNNSVVWDTPLFKFNDGSVALNKKAALEKRLPAGDYDRAYSSTLVQKMINPRSGLSTDNIVRFSNKNRYNATKFYRVHDGPIELGNMPYDYPINETVLNPTTESYVLPYGSSKLGLLKQLESNNYITLPLLWSQQNYTNK